MAYSYSADTGVRGPAVRRMSWGAVLAGVAVLLVVHLILGLAGLAAGLATVDPQTGDTPSAGTLATSAGIFWIVTAIIATFAGAWTAGRLAGAPARTDGMLHGIVAWATATLLVVYLATSSAGSILGGTFSTLGSAAKGIAQGGGNVADSLVQNLPDNLRDQVQGLFQKAQDQAQQTGQQAQQATGAQNPADAARRVINGVKEGATPEDRQAAVNLISQQAGIPPEEADRRLGEFQNSYNQAVQQARDAAQKATKAAASAAFWSVVALVIGLIVAAIAGGLGAPRDDEYTA